MFLAGITTIIIIVLGGQRVANLLWIFTTSCCCVNAHATSSLGTTLDRFFVSPFSSRFVSLLLLSRIAEIEERIMSGSNGHAAAVPPSSSMMICLPNWFDPTRAFSLLVIAIMSIRYLAVKNWDVKLLLQGFYVHPGVVVPFLVASVPYMLRHHQHHRTSASSQPLSKADRGAAEWYWWNAWLYHTAMDGLSGSFHVVPVVVQQYFILDQRFVNRHVVPWLVGVVELLIMAPLCIATIHSIVNPKNNHNNNNNNHGGYRRWALELITSTFQLFGMIAFVGAEVYEGQLNVPALDPVGSSSGRWTGEGGRWSNVRFNVYHLTYYWFGFWFCNLVWGVVPLWRIYRACQECTKAFAALEQQHVEGGKAKAS